jgi:hypothetical protein
MPDLANPGFVTLSLLQLLALHGMSSSKFNRTELLQALKGKHIVNPTSIFQPYSAEEEGHTPAVGAAQASSAGSAPASHSSVLPFSDADLGSLGWAVDPGCALEQLQLSMPAEFQAAAAGVSPPTTGQAPAPAAAPTPAAATTAAAIATAVANTMPSTAPMHAAAAATIALPQQPYPAATGVVQQQQQQLVLASHDQQHAAPKLASSAAVQDQTQQQAQQAAANPCSVAPSCSQPELAGQVQHKSDNHEEQAAAAAAAAAVGVADPMQALLQRAGLQDGCSLPSHVHTPWMLQQLRLFVACGAVASQEKLPPPPAAAGAAAGVPGAGGGSLLGRGVGFVLLEDMQVAGPKGTALTLPAGVYEVRTIT